MLRFQRRSWMSILNATQCHVIMPFINNVLYVDYELITCRNPLLHLHGYTSTCPKIFHCLKHIHIHLNICCTHVAKIYSGYIMRDFIMRFLKSIDIVRSDFLLWYTFEHSQLIDQLESRQYPNRVLRHWLFS